MHPKTEALLKACARARWENTAGPVADAINAWQSAGCPDAPEMESPKTIIEDLISGLEKLETDEQLMSRKEITAELTSLVSEARFKLRELQEN
jgi:hypothetical protein